MFCRTLSGILSSASFALRMELDVEIIRWITSLNYYRPFLFRDMIVLLDIYMFFTCFRRILYEARGQVCTEFESAQKIDYDHGY
ncbi:hypothetical protein GCM10028868_37940 [Virgibacillus kimchii]